MNNDCVVVEGLTVQYDKTPVLWDVCFSIPKGRLVGLLGPNGAGKSTLFKSFLGMVRPISGKVTFMGKSFLKMRKQIAYVPQKSQIDWDFPITVKELVMMGRFGSLGLWKWPSKRDRKIVAEALEKVGMSAFADRQIDELSGGQKQRVFVARALVQQADLYLLDEPFVGIDRTTEKILIDLFVELKEEGKTILIVHHDLSTVEHYFDWLVMLNTCKIADGPIEEVFTSTNICRTYGENTHLLEKVAKACREQTVGR